jgi:hypothetical protein
MSHTLSAPRAAAIVAVNWLNDVVSLAGARDAGVTRRTAAIALLISCLGAAIPARASDPAREATIQPETKARLTLQSQISSKLSEAGDAITATLTDPIYVEGEMVLPRGAEFHCRIMQIAPAKRGPRSSSMSITFERVVTASGTVPVSTQVTAIDDWDKEETVKANSKGKMKGGHRGEKTIDNAAKGASLGFSTGLVGVALGGAAGSSGRQALGIAGIGVAVGLIGGVLVTKGSEIRAAQGSILRIKFLKAATLPVVQQSGTVRNHEEQKEAKLSDKL